MLESIHIRNFRSIDDSKELKLSNLNILVGPNNAGKSSILYSLLLMKQTIEEENLGINLITSGPHIDLGSYIEIMPEHNSSLNFTFKFKLKEYSGDIKIMDSQKKRIKKISGLIDYEYEFAFFKDENEVKLVKSILKDQGGNIRIETKFENGKLKLLSLPKELEPHITSSTDHLIPQFFPKGKKAPEGKKLLDQALELLFFSQINTHILKESMRKLKYIAPIRERIPRYGMIGSMPYSELGPSGQNLMKVLSTSKNIGPEKDILKQLNRWLDTKFKLLKNVRIVDIDEGKTVKSLVANDIKGGKDINLCAMGCGISQLVPVIIQTILLPVDGCLLVEQPEIHLHPKAQADLADLFIEGAKKKKQFLIETHSEHFILRVRRRIAEGKIDPAKVKIFVIEKKKGKTTIKQMAFNGKGHFTQWPKGFFEEGYKETLAITKANIKQAGGKK